MKQDIEAYLNSLKYERNYSINTISGYQEELDKYCHYIDENKLDYLQITKEQIWDYLKYLDQFHYANRTLSRHMTSIRSFYTYLKENNKVATNVFKMIHNPKLDKRLPNV